MGLMMREYISGSLQHHARSENIRTSTRGNLIPAHWTSQTVAKDSTTAIRLR